MGACDNQLKGFSAEEPRMEEKASCVLRHVLGAKMVETFQSNPSA
jgi:hypothetical protein